MENKIALTGISFEYNTTIFYEYDDLYMIQFFKCLLESNVLKLSKINLRYESNSDETFFLNIISSGDKWIVEDHITPPFAFEHNSKRNLFDEIEEFLPFQHNSLRSAQVAQLHY